MNRYWIATTQESWDSTANWSTTSGGAGGASIPDATTDVYFDSTGSGDCDLASDATAASITLDGYVGRLDAQSYDVEVGDIDCSDISTDGIVDLGSGTWTISGDADLSGFASNTKLVRGTSTLNFDGTGTFTIPEVATLILYRMEVATDASIFVAGLGASYFYLYGGLHVWGDLEFDTEDLGISLPKPRVYYQSFVIYEGGSLTAGSINAYYLNYYDNGGGFTCNGTLSCTNFYFYYARNYALFGGTGTIEVSHYLYFRNISTSDCSMRWDAGNYTLDCDRVYFKTDGEPITIDLATNSPNITFDTDLWIDFDGTANIIVESGGNFTFNGDVAYLPATGGELVWNKGSGTISFEGSGDQDIDWGGSIVEDSTIDKSGGTLTFENDYHPQSLTITDGTVDFGNNTFDIYDGWSGVESASVDYSSATIYLLGCQIYPELGSVLGGSAIEEQLNTYHETMTGGSLLGGESYNISLWYRPDCACGSTYTVGTSGGASLGGECIVDDGIYRATGGLLAASTAIVWIPTQSADGVAIWPLGDYTEISGKYDGTAGYVAPSEDSGLYCLDAMAFEDGASVTLPQVPFAKWSISCWVKIEGFHQDRCIFSMGDFSLRHSSLNHIYASLAVNDGTIDTTWGVYSDDTLKLSTWHHIAASFDGTTCSIFLDGVLSNSDDMSSSDTLLGNTGGFIARNTRGSYFTGTLQDVRFWSEAKPAAWFAAEYDNYCDRVFWGIMS